MNKIKRTVNLKRFLVVCSLLIVWIGTTLDIVLTLLPDVSSNRYVMMMGCAIFLGGLTSTLVVGLLVAVGFAVRELFDWVYPKF